MEERTAGEKTDCFGDTGLEETAELRVLVTMRRQELSKSEEGREGPASVSQSNARRTVTYLFVKHRS